MNFGPKKSFAQNELIQCLCSTECYHLICFDVYYPNILWIRPQLRNGIIGLLLMFVRAVSTYFMPMSLFSNFKWTFHYQNGKLIVRNSLEMLWLITSNLCLISNNVELNVFVSISLNISFDIIIQLYSNFFHLSIRNQFVKKIEANKQTSKSATHLHIFNWHTLVLETVPCFEWDVLSDASMWTSAKENEQE